MQPANQQFRVSWQESSHGAWFVLEGLDAVERDVIVRDLTADPSVSQLLIEEQ